MLGKRPKSLAVAGLLRPQNVLSFVRPVLGLIILVELASASTSAAVLPAAVVACLSDLADGATARKRNESSRSGRYVDNLCDLVFLAAAFAGFALAATWSHPVVGSAIRYSPHANWLPLVALATSFGTYVLRWPLEAAGQAPAVSAQGHSAGIANYALVLLGGVAVWPGVFLSPWILEPSFVTVALLNLSAGAENLGIWFRARAARRV